MLGPDNNALAPAIPSLRLVENILKARSEGEELSAYLAQLINNVFARNLREIIPKGVEEAPWRVGARFLVDFFADAV